MAASVETVTNPPQQTQQKRKHRGRLLDLKRLKKNWQLYVLIIPTFLCFLIFSYIPMYGVLIAFKDYVPVLGVWNSPWVGFKYFNQFFTRSVIWGPTPPLTNASSAVSRVNSRRPPRVTNARNAATMIRKPAMWSSGFAATWAIPTSGRWFTAGRKKSSTG